MIISEFLRNKNDVNDKHITLVGACEKPRTKHSDFLFFNLTTSDFKDGIQCVIRKDVVGDDKFYKLTHMGLQYGDILEVSGTLQERLSNRNEFYETELIVNDIKIAKTKFHDYSNIERYYDLVNGFSKLSLRKKRKIRKWFNNVGCDYDF